VTANRRAPRQEVFCRACRGRAKNPSGGPPIGWYQLTVGVPEYMETVKGRSYRWAGLFCSASCLAAGMNQIKQDEALERQAYDPEIPY
jgi:hypothetical protein